MSRTVSGRDLVERERPRAEAAVIVQGHPAALEVMMTARQL